MYGVGTLDTKPLYPSEPSEAARGKQTLQVRALRGAHLYLAPADLAVEWASRKGRAALIG